MASLLGHLHFWSLRKFAAGTGSDIGTHVYHEKASGSAGSSGEGTYSDQRKLWGEDRGVLWTPRNRRPEKLRDSLKEIEDMLQHCKVLTIRWRTLRNIQLLLSNGALVSVLVSFTSGDIEKIWIDKSLAGKIPDQIGQAITTDSFLLFSLMDKAKLCYVYFNKKPSLEFKKLEKLSALEPKTLYIDLPGPASKRIERHLSVNSRQDMVVVWWTGHSEEAWPWSPMTGEKDRANLVIVGVNGPKVEILCFVRTECDPIHAAFSVNQPHHVHTLEQSSAGGGDSSVDSCIYEYTGTKVERVAATTIPVKAAIVIQQRNHAEDKLLLGCEDGTLMLYDNHRRVTQMTKASLIPSLIQWHPGDAVVLVCSANGDIQVFDMALAPVLLQLPAEKPSPRHMLELRKYFTNQVKLNDVSWSCETPIGNIVDNSIGCHDNLLILFDRGPLCLLRFELGVLTNGRLGTVEMVSEYIKYDQAEQAVNFLNSMNWNTEGRACFACLTLVMNYLLKLPLNSEREGLLEETLGSFYAPSRPLSDVTVLEFRDSISKLSRRFFHHLLRYKRFEKAFLLAVDIGAKDLFMDIHYLACDLGNYPLAEVAKQRAIQLDNEPLTSDTGESYDDDEDDLSYTEGEVANGERSGEAVHYRDNEYNYMHNHVLTPQHLMPVGEEDDDGAILMLHGAQGNHYSGEDADELDLDTLEERGSPAGNLKIVHFGVV